jgi:hypothetical protein
MKNNLLKYYTLAFYLCSNLVIFAQGPSTEGGVETDDQTVLGSTSAVESDDAAAAPIDTYLWILALVAILYVFFKYRAIQNKRIQS